MTTNDDTPDILFLEACQKDSNGYYKETSNGKCLSMASFQSLIKHFNHCKNSGEELNLSTYDNLKYQIHGYGIEDKDLDDYIKNFEDKCNKAAMKNTGDKYVFPSLLRRMPVLRSACKFDSDTKCLKLNNILIYAANKNKCNNDPLCVNIYRDAIRIFNYDIDFQNMVSDLFSDALSDTVNYTKIIPSSKDFINQCKELSK